MTQFERGLPGQGLADAILAATSDGVMVLSADGRILLVNERGLKLNELTSATDVRGFDYADLWPAADRAAVRAALQTAREGQAARIEGYCPTQRGTPRWLEVDFASFEPGEGEPQRIVALSRDISQRRDAEARLDQLADLHRQIVDAATDTAIIGTDETGQVVRWSVGAARITGWSEQEMLGEPLATIFTPVDRAAGRPDLEMRIADETGWASDKRWHLTKDGRRFYANGSVTPLTGPTRGYVKSFRDATQEHEAHEALTQSRQKLGAALDIAALGTFDWNTRTNVVELSARSRDIFGFGADEGERAEEILARIHPDDRSLFLAPDLVNPLETPRLELQYRVVLPDGAIRHVKSVREAAAENSDEPDRLVGIVEDITDRRVVEQQLHELNDLLERRAEDRTRERDRMWRISGDLMGVATSDGTLLAVNQAWTTMLGWTEAEVLATNFADLMHGDDVQPTIEEMHKLDRGGTTLRFESRCRSIGGDHRLIAWTASPEQGRFYAIGRDITEQRKVEDALRQSQKMEAVGQLTGGIAHDFNNLLTGIIGSLDLIKRRMDAGRTDGLARYMDAASTAAQRAAALTHRLLAFARRQSLDTRPQDINALVAGMEDMLRRTLGEGVVLETVLEAGLSPVLTDANQLENALLNLAINARDAMPGGGQLLVKTARGRIDDAFARSAADVTAGDYIVLSVSDTGTGMSPEVIARAFDPFFTTKPIGHGTGLGLSMIYGFAKQSGGHVVIASEVGRGTCVKLYLPQALENGEEPRVAALGEAPRGLGETVLLVEDDAAVRMLVTEVLDELGYRYIEASDARTAIPVLQSREHLDLLVTDVGLPHLNGRQLAEIARQARPDLKVLFITGYAETAALRDDFLEPGMEMMTKPFALDALAAKIRHLIGTSVT